MEPAQCVHRDDQEVHTIQSRPVACGVDQSFWFGRQDSYGMAMSGLHIPEYESQPSWAGRSFYYTLTRKIASYACRKRVINMEIHKCPQCGSTRTSRTVNATKLGTSLGAGIGGFVGLLAKRGIAVVGAAAGGLSGGVMGLISGAILGNTVGKTIDELFGRTWRCEECGHEFK